MANDAPESVDALTECVEFDANAVAVRRQLDVKDLHAKALAKLDSLTEKNLQPRHAALFFEAVEKKSETAQQQKGNCMSCGACVVSTGAFKFGAGGVKLNCILQPRVKSKIRKINKKVKYVLNIIHP